MRMMTSCVLISFSPDAHEVGSDPVSTRRTVKCQELSLTQADIYQAGGEGLNPEAKLLIPFDRDYHGERGDGEAETTEDADSKDRGQRTQ